MRTCGWAALCVAVEVLHTLSSAYRSKPLAVK